MSPEDVRERVRYIALIGGDDEIAHGEEDKLHQDVLRAIADGADNAPALARMALDTLNIPFARWCA